MLQTNVKSISSLCFLELYSHQSSIVGPLYVSVCMCMYVRLCVCVCARASLYPLFYPQLREADRSRRSSSMGLGGPVVKDAAPPVPVEPRLEMVALSEYSWMTSNWPPSSPSSSVCVSSSSSSLSTT